jgi:catechol 2,3-dioxygenase-like lactoylglutathione lyase family enzyme
MTSMFHTGVTVPSLEKAIPFYRDVLGFPVVQGPTDPAGGEEFSRALGVPNALLQLVVLQVGDDYLELLEYITPPSERTEPVPINTVGAMHIAFQVDDIEAKVAELSAKGVTFLSDVQSIDEGPLAGWRWVYFKDPAGVMLEMIQLTGPAAKSVDA